MTSDHLEYARRLRQAGFSEEQATGQAQALAAVMTDSLATREDLQTLAARMDSRFEAVDARFDALDKQLEIRFSEQEKRLEIRLAELELRVQSRFGEHEARFDGRLADLERRVTFRLGGLMVAGIGTVSALVRIL